VIRSAGRTGPAKVTGLVLWELRFNLLAMVAVAAVMVPIPDTIQTDNATAVLSVLGIAASIFIGFRNSNAYNRWWEARTLWGSVIINCRALHNGLISLDDDSDAILERALDRGAEELWRHHYWKEFNGFNSAFKDPWGNTLILWTKGGDDPQIPEGWTGE